MAAPAGRDNPPLERTAAAAYFTAVERRACAAAAAQRQYVMRRKKSPLPWLFRLAAAVSLLLCAAVVAVWVRSQSVCDEVLLRGEQTTTLEVMTEGYALFLRQWLPYDGRGERPTGVFHLVQRQWNLRMPAYPPGTPLLKRLGFDAYGFYEPALFGGAPARAVWIPYWFLVLLTLTAPTLWLWAVVRRLRRNGRAAFGLCPLCGYDLRATPKRCPECGAVPRPPHNPPCSGPEPPV